LGELRRYRDHVNFKILSENENVQWSYDMINEFEELWEWKSIEKNLSINSKVTLGLLFPERVGLIVCDCMDKKDFCDCYKQRPRNFKYENSLKSEVDKESFSMSFAIDLMIQNEINADDLESVFIDKIFPVKFMIKEILEDL